MKEYHSLRTDIEDVLAESGFQDRTTHRPITGVLVLSGLTYQHDHVFPSSEVLLEIGDDCGLCFHRTLAMILKNEWESSFADEANSGRADGDCPLLPVLSEAQDHVTQTANFNPDTAAIFTALENHEKLAAQAGYCSADFDTLVQQMILSELHVAKNSGPEITRFIESEKARIDMLRDSTPEEQQEFWAARCRWTQIQDTLDSLHFQCEKHRLQNAETRREYLAEFGKYEVELQEATYRYCDVKRRRMLKEANPHLNHEEIGELVAQEEDRHAKELRDLKSAADLAPILERRLHGGADIDYDKLQEYRVRAKKLLRMLAAKTHEDHLRHDPAYKKLTEKQKEELQAMLREALQISLEEIGFPEGCIEHDMRSVSGLEAALARVDAILENAGIDTRIDLVIRGKTLRDQLEWLREATKSLERRIESARAELHALATDPEVERMRQILACAEQHEKIRQEMKNKTREYTEKANAIEKQMEELFKQDGKDAV